MKSRIGQILLAVLLLIGFDRYPAEAQKQAATKAKTADKDTTAVEEDALEYTRPVLEYENGGKRDPFESLAPKQETVEARIKGFFNYEGASLKGVVKTPDDAYALVADKDGLGYVLREGYRVFGGYVTSVTDNAVQFHIVKYGRAMSITMRLASSKSTVIEEREPGESLVQKPGIIIQYRKGAPSDESDAGVVIDNVVVPSLDTKTVDEIWFGAENQPNGTQDEEHPVNKGTFVMFDPPNGAVITVPYVLDWTSIESEGVTYTVIIDDNADFSSPLFVKDGITASSCVIGESGELPVGVDLYWTVTGYDASGAGNKAGSVDMKFRVR